MKKNEIVFLHGLIGLYGKDGTRASAPLVVSYDEDSITLTKGEGFEEWLDDETPVRSDIGDPSTFKEENFKKLFEFDREITSQDQDHHEHHGPNEEEEDNDHQD